MEKRWAGRGLKKSFSVHRACPKKKTNYGEERTGRKRNWVVWSNAIDFEAADGAGSDLSRKKNKTKKKKKKK